MENHYDVETLMFGTTAAGKRPKRTWKEMEQHQLLHILKAMVTEGLKGTMGSRYRSWPMYEDLFLILGTDRADGRLARGFASSLQQLLNKEAIGTKRPHFDGTDSFTADLQAAFNQEGHNKENIDPLDVNVASGFTQKKPKSYVLTSKRVKADPVPGGGGEFQKKMERFIEGTENRLREIGNQLFVEPAEKPKQEDDLLLNARIIMETINLINVPTIVRICTTSRNSTNPVYSTLFLKMNDLDQQAFVNAMAEGQIP